MWTHELIFLFFFFFSFSSFVFVLTSPHLQSITPHVIKFPLKTKSIYIYIYTHTWLLNKTRWQRIQSKLLLTLSLFFCWGGLRFSLTLFHFPKRIHCSMPLVSAGCRRFWLPAAVKCTPKSKKGPLSVLTRGSVCSFVLTFCFHSFIVFRRGHFSSNLDPTLWLWLRQWLRLWLGGCVRGSGLDQWLWLWMGG